MKIIILNSKVYSKRINLIFLQSKNCITIYGTNSIKPSIDIYDSANVYIIYKNKQTNLKS
jgi:hypothetical protein